MQPFGPWWTSCSPTFLRLLPLSFPWCLSWCRGQQERFKICQGRWNRLLCLLLDPTAFRNPWPCTQTSGRWSSWLSSSHKGVVSLSGWLHCQSWCIVSLAALEHHCLCHTGKVPFLLSVPQDTQCTPSAFPCVAWWSALDVPCSLLLQGLRLCTHLDWPVRCIPKLGPRWWYSTSPLVWLMQGTCTVAPWQNGWTSVWWRPHRVTSQECWWIWELLYLWSLLWHLLGQQVFCMLHSWMILMTSLLLRFWRGRMFDVKILKMC